MVFNKAYRYLKIYILLPPHHYIIIFQIHEIIAHFSERFQG